eukprot:TRINITY_DN99293_c0_g1_i1.p1 TRINITY_DN99293_c0_g1~~TRINITY_DN99293_c0_g1_i1.p1  ORF type:complete len:337 (+),score=64.65 TRINITY_DN99293_c0_g1_i1:108-1118(+)
MANGIGAGSLLDLQTAPLRGEKLQEELLRLRAECEALEAEAEEEEASSGVVLNDVELERLRLNSLLQRYREKAPSAEALSERHMGVLEKLAAEVQRLREENSFLATQSNSKSRSDDEVSTFQTRHTTPIRSAAEELHDEVRKLRCRYADYRRSQRQSRLEEWRLSQCKSEAKNVIHEMRIQEKQLEEMKKRVNLSENSLEEVKEHLEATKLEAEEEQALIRDLNREVMSTREACYVPARLKREASFLMKVLDQEGGRLKTRRHLRSLEAVKKLYDEVSTCAPAILPFASRAKSEMEMQFSRYLQLEEGHNRALQRLHLSVTRGVLNGKGSQTQSIP